MKFLLISVMHDLRLIHTDLKPENILLVSSDYVKVPDYKVFLFTLLILFPNRGKLVLVIYFD